MKFSRIIWLLFIACASLLSSCMSATFLEVVKPADIDVPSEIESFSVVQRNEAPKGSRRSTNWEGLVSGEGIGLDNKSAEFATMGLILELSKSPRFTIKQFVSNDKFYGTGTLKMAEPLNWETVELICEKSNSQALIVIETFDSDLDRDVISREVITNSKGERVSEKVFDSNIKAKIYIGWRIYYPNQKKIIDVFEDDASLKESSSWGTERDANNDLTRVEYLVKKGAQTLGAKYARRISPSNVKLTRYYYIRGSSDLKRAKSNMLSKDYNTAIEIWESEFYSANKLKIKGRSAYNLAVGFESKSDYEMAIKWAQESIDSGNIKAKGYLIQLESRRRDELRLKRQMNATE
jgi:hypothetical protein